MKNFPFILRSTLVAVLLPLMMTAFVMLFAIHKQSDYSLIARIYGVSRLAWFDILLGVLPTLMLLLVFLKGYWRFALIVMFTAVTVIVVYATREAFTPPDLRIIRCSFIHCSFICEGTDVYCNGVKLGTTPFDITVGELKKKVPVWNEPPEQKWFVNGDTPLYTWVPWDDFIRERLEERLFLDPKQSILPFDAKSSYWWRFEYQGINACCFAGRSYRMENFDKMTEYYLSSIAWVVYPSTWAHVDLLLGVLDDDNDKPSPEWIDYAANRTGNLAGILYDKNIGRIQNDAILTAIAKRRYGLSETPTAEECDKTIERILAEHKIHSYFTHFQLPMRHNMQNIQYFDVFCEHFGYSFDCRDVIVKHAIRAMGPACKEQLLRRFRTFSEGFDDSSGAILYMLGEYCFPEAFDEVFCHYARSHTGFRELMKYPDERLVPLLHTLLTPKVDFFWFFSGGSEYRDYEKVVALLAIENNLLEPTIRAFLAETLPQFTNHDVGGLLQCYAETRKEFDGADNEEIAEWIESLRVAGQYKTEALRELRQPPEVVETLGQNIITNDGSPVYTLTEASLLAWIKKNPDRMIEDLLVELDPDLLDSAESLKWLVLGGVIRLNKPEAKEIISLLWKKPENRDEILVLLHGIYTPAPSVSYRLDELRQEQQTRLNQQIRLPGTYTNVNRLTFDAVVSATLPEYFVALFDELDDPKTCVGLTSLLLSVETPDALALLTKWSESDSSWLKRHASESRELLSLRLKLKDERRRLFNDLVSGKITPDDLLLPTKPFIWDGKQYVEKP